MADLPDQEPVPIPDNPMFAGAPTYYWRQRLDPDEAAEGHDNLMNWISARLAEQVAADGVEQEVSHVVGENTYTFRLTANSGFFKIVIIPSADLGDEQRPLVLAFSFRDLYLVGFLHNAIWQIFNDADLEGSGHLEHPDAYHPLGFDGSYNDDHFDFVQLSNYTIHLSYESLMHYPNRSRDEILVALFRIIVVVPEAIRYPRWRARVKVLLGEMITEMVGRMFSRIFKTWSTISKKARRGPARFEVRPGDDFTTYESLAINLDGGVALGRPPAAQL